MKTIHWAVVTSTDLESNLPLSGRETNQAEEKK